MRTALGAQSYALGVVGGPDAFSTGGGVVFKNIINMLSNDIGIDLGTANTLVACRGKGIVLSEPSFVTVYKGSNEVFYRDGQPAIGRLAKEGDGFVPENLDVIRPMKDGVIANYEIAGVMLNYFIKKAQSGLSLIKPRQIGRAHV